MDLMPSICLRTSGSDQETPVTFSPKAFLAKVGAGRSIGTYSVDQAIFLQGNTADAVFYLQEAK